MPSRRGSLLQVLVLAGFGAAGCSRAGGVKSPGAPVILISIDTVRSDHLPAYGYRGIETPAVDAFARDAVLYERAFSHYPLTFPSHASILTGLLPPQHGVRDNKGYVLGDDQTTLAERLRAAGYRTAGIVSSMVLGRQTGIGQGFEEFDDQMETGTRKFPQRRGADSIAIAEAWLDRLPQGQTPFLFLHLFEPHTPYEAPEPYASRYKDAYDAEIAWSDHLLGGFLDHVKARGLYEPSLIVLLSDHGEGRGDHAELEHGLLLYRESLQVPLLVKLPGRKRGGERIKEPVGLVDVVPTILALLKLDRSGLPGVALFESGGRSADRPLYAETFFGLSQYGWSELQSVVAGDLHYVQAPRPELYDLAADPAEVRNLLPGRAVPEGMRAAIAALGRGKESTREVPREEAEQLAALGYVGGTEAHEPRSDRPDPKDHIRDVAELWTLMDKIGTSDSLQAETRVLAIIESLGVKRENLRRTIATNMMRAGRAGTAARVLAPFDTSPDPATQVLAGQIAASLGRFAEAEAHFRAALEREPRNAAAQAGIGIVLLGRGRPGPAREALERAVADDAGLAEAWNALGVVHAQAGETGAAVSAWERAVAIDPSLADAWFNLALLYQKAGARDQAIQALERYVHLAQGRDRAQGEALLARLKGGAPAPR